MKTLFHKRLKQGYYRLCAEMTSELYNLKSGNIKAPSLIDKIIIGLSSLVGVSFGASSFSFAAEPTLFSKARTLLKDYYGYFLSLSTLIAIVCIVVCLICIMFSDGMSTRKAVAFIKKVILAWFLINILGGILAIGKELTDGLSISNEQLNE